MNWPDVHLFMLVGITDVLSESSNTEKVTTVVPVSVNRTKRSAAVDSHICL